MVKPEKTVDNLTSQLYTFEKALLNKSENHQEVLVTRTNKYKASSSKHKQEFKCNYCDQFGHRGRQCSK